MHNLFFTLLTPYNACSVSYFHTHACTYNSHIDSALPPWCHSNSSYHIWNNRNNKSVLNMQLFHPTPPPLHPHTVSVHSHTHTHGTHSKNPSDYNSPSFQPSGTLHPYNQYTGYPCLGWSGEGVTVSPSQAEVVSRLPDLHFLCMSVICLGGLTLLELLVNHCTHGGG